MIKQCIGIPDMILLFKKTLNYTFVIKNKIILVLKQSSEIILMKD